MISSTATPQDHVAVDFELCVPESSSSCAPRNKVSECSNDGPIGTRLSPQLASAHAISAQRRAEASTLTSGWRVTRILAGITLPGLAGPPQSQSDAPQFVK